MHRFLLNYAIVSSALKKKNSGTTSLIEMKTLVQMKVPLPPEKPA